MQIDIRDFPIVWMREHDQGDDHDDEAEGELLMELLARGKRFVVVAERMPRLSDFAEAKPGDRRQRARMFKAYRAEMARLCAGMILIGRASGLPLPIRKAMEAMTSVMGVALLFAEDEPTAIALAGERLNM